MTAVKERPIIFREEQVRALAAAMGIEIGS